MSDITFGTRVKTIFDLIGSQSFFLTLFAIAVFTILMIIINYRIQSKAPKIVALILYIGLIILILLRYGNYVASFNDSVVEKVFKAVYFPNVVVYACMLIISLLLLAVTFVDVRFTKVTKICNTACFCTIWFLFVLFLDTVKKAEINFYEITEVYSNATVMIILQTSMWIFIVWLVIFLMDFVVRLLADKNKKTTN